MALEEVKITPQSSDSNSGLYLSILALGVSRGEHIASNKNTWYNLREMRSYSQRYYGNQYRSADNIAKAKGVSGTLSKTLKWAGRGLGVYNLYNINDAYENQIVQYNGRPMTSGVMVTEQVSNGIATFGGLFGAGWGIGWEVGRGIAGNSDYRRFVRPKLQDFLGIERDEYSRSHERLMEIIENER